MKLRTKLTLFLSISKLTMVILIVSLLPYLVNMASYRYTDYYLGEQKNKVLQEISKNGLNYYLQGDSAYASYTMLKEEYISIVPEAYGDVKDTIETSRRIVGADTLDYRILVHALRDRNRNYFLEIGKKTATIGEYNTLLQQFTLIVLIILVALSIILDLAYTQVLLLPFSKIVRTKLLNQKFPFGKTFVPVRTSTSDFKILDSSLISLMQKIHEAFEKEREFTSNASHELMTPISILKSKVENLLMTEQISEDLQEKLTGLLKTIAQLKKIVQSLLYISRIENDQFVKGETVSIHGMFMEVMQELSPRLESRSISFKITIPPRLNVKMVNRDLIFQLFYNLLNNAIRYNTDKGSIDINGYFTDNHRYCIEIQNTGPGIKPEDLATIFDRFKKSGHALGEGYGLGLSIVKSILSFHDFSISVHSKPGENTVFSILIPGNRIVP